MKIEIFNRPKRLAFGLHMDQWFFRILADNHKIVAQSEGYRRRASAEKTARLLKAGLGGAEIVVGGMPIDGPFPARPSLPSDPNNAAENYVERD